MNVYDLVIADKEKIALEDVFLDDLSRRKLQQLIKEHRYIQELSKYGLPVSNKILLHGYSGCGKTTTAKALATALEKPIYVLNLSNLISSRIGETSQHIRQVFDKAGREKAVLFLDEFDQIGKARISEEKDVGEMRRLVNTIIQLIDYFPDEAVLIAATNHPEILDTAIIRRFQLRLAFELPTNVQLDAYYDKLFSPFPHYDVVVPRLYRISYAEAKDYVYDAVKSLLITALEKNESSPK
ncbi:ATP-binding protein [Sphingobacterium sp. N143]|uniref:AAA family ATPase n=1 Tax=Sphingobacterium sp. N143 TaxID=2746727 RepID=UPI00257716CE|nr:ATP-binding protein [Sphingobacterium sp. N143]MDM1294643.1 ATP-binding protein [Sphingobacterium sp. N143]